MDRLHIAITAVGVFFFLWFAAPFVGRGILNIGNLTGMVVFALLFLYGIYHRKVHAFVGSAWRSRSGKILLVCVAILFLCVAVTAVAETIGMVRVAMRRPPENTTAVVLGCSVKGERPSRILEERLDAAYTYLEDNPRAICVLSGGQGKGEDISEAECMYRYLTERGIAPERLLKEDSSTTTEENLKYSIQLLKEQGMDSKITIVTSEFHEYRANKTAERLGITSYSTPSHTFFIYFLTYYVRELYGILYYMIR